MGQYENEFSNFPSKKITKHNFRNVNDGIANLINKIKHLQSQGLYEQAANLIQNNKETLSQYIVDAVTFRTWEEEIYNAQKYAKQIQQSIYFEENENDVDCLDGDVWVGGV